MGKYTNIDDPSAYFQTATYTGNNNQSITNDGNSDLQPDFVWIKRRSNADHHSLTNSSLGVNKQLLSSSSNGEQSRTDQIQSFNTDGFTLGTDGAGYTNVPGNTYVAWQWKANGGTTASNTDGDINSTVQVNSDAGFSIVTYTGNFTGSQGVGHGLGVRPDVVIIKNREQALNWIVWTSSLASGNFLSLDTTNAASSSSRIYQNGYTTSTFGIGANNSVNKSGIDYIAYCFASKQGYSKFGSYVGNGGTGGNNVFVYTGFKPAFIMIKNADAAGHWAMQDYKRNGYNGQTQRVWANRTNSESGAALDLLSNGFKITSTAGGYGASGNKYIYMAFAENPFTTSTGIPTTAR